MEESIILEARAHLDGITNGKCQAELENLILSGLKIIHLEKGVLRCKYVINERVSGEDGVWDIGAIASTMDVISYVTTYSIGGKVHSTLTLNSTFFSTAKIHETVEIEGRVTGTKGNIKAVITEIRREENGEVIAKGNLWMTQLPVGLKDLPTLFPKPKL